jgi:hypothetical protein
MQDYDDERTAVTENAGADVPAAAKADTPTVPPGHKLVDPFAHYAAIEGGDALFNGDYAKIDQEEHRWVRGQKKEPIGTTEPFVANVHEARHGWITFAKGDGERVERHTILIMECPELPPCPACGNIVDEHDDKRCDCRPVVYLLLRSVADPDDVVCFTGTGNGARRAVAKLCRVYAREGPDRQGKSPAITLNTWSFDNKSGGKTTWPDFKNIGWEFFTPGVPAPEPKLVAVPIAPPTKPAAAKLATPARKRGDLGDLDDEIAF